MEDAEESRTEFEVTVDPPEERPLEPGRPTAEGVLFFVLGVGFALGTLLALL
jgi:hypothetical protein